jgi:hypothetical protein
MKKKSKKKEWDFSVEITPSERTALKGAYLRFLAGKADDGVDVFDLFPADDLFALVDKGLMEKDEQNRWFITSDGHWLAKILVSEKTPFEKAFIKPGPPPEHN